MLLDKIHKLYDKEEKVKDRTSFFISEADKCPVAIFYSFKKASKARLGPQAYLRFEDGNDTHKRLVKSLSKVGILIADEVNIPHNELFTGRADAVVKIDKEFYIVEIKSVNNSRFQRLTNLDTSDIEQSVNNKENEQQEINNAVRQAVYSKQKEIEEIIKQIQLYLYYFDIDKGIILIENKNTQELKEFIVKKDIELINKILTDFDILKIQIADSELPAKPRNLPWWKCKFCSYRKTCAAK